MQGCDRTRSTIALLILMPELDIALLVKYVTYFDQYDAVTEFIQALKQG
jgi:hypothetical protein